MAACPQSFLDEHGTVVKTTLEIVQGEAKALMEDPKAPERIAERYSLQVEDARAWFAETQWGQGFDVPEEALMRAITSLNNLGVIEQPDAQASNVFEAL